MGQGAPGPLGPQGPKGEQGPQGLKGESGNVGWIDFNESQKLELINKLKNFPEFKGLKGDQGIQGVIGPPGTIDTEENKKFLKTNTMWCADGDFCSVPKRSIFPKLPGFDKSSVQIGNDNQEPNDSNIYSLAFGKAEGNTYTGMGLIPNDKKMFPSTKGPILGTHIKAENEWGIYSDGWNKLFAVQGGSGTIGIRGDARINASNIVIGATQDKNRWILHAPNDDRRGLWIAPGNGSDNWDWGKATSLFSNGVLGIGNGWSLDATDGHLRFKYNGEQKMVIHNNGTFWSAAEGWLNGFVQYAPDGANNDGPWVQLRSGAGNKCLDAGSNGQDCDWNNGWRRFKIVKSGVQRHG